MGLSFSTPVISKTLEPMPLILAPIFTNMLQRSTISGSRATLSTLEFPLAKTAAITTFSVAPTLGKSSAIFAPLKPFSALTIK